MCFSPLNRVCHWGPLLALSIIKCVTGMTVHCTSMWWPPDRSTGGLINFVTFMSLAGLTLYNFLSAIFHGPGYLSLKWKPKDPKDTVFLQYCGVCEGYKAPRAHHCRKCNRCVLKMDHHCPWINNCVGWSNHAHFTSFLFFAVLGCFHASIILTASLYHAMHRLYYIYHGTGHEPIIHLTIYSLILTVFSLGLAIGVVLAVGMLFFFQIRAIIRNRTGIEDWILEKANHRRVQGEFKFPYDLGLRRNLKQVLTWNCGTVGDGIEWEVADGCDQFTLTREQIEQKGEKRLRTKIYEVVKPISGSWLPITQGFKVCLQPPCSDEPRLKLNVGDIIYVTRWRKHWMFGEKSQSPDLKKAQGRYRGWFPRQCTVEVTEGDDPMPFKKNQ